MLLFYLSDPNSCLSFLGVVAVNGSDEACSNSRIGGNGIGIEVKYNSITYPFPALMVVIPALMVVLSQHQVLSARQTAKIAKSLERRQRI